MKNLILIIISFLMYSCNTKESPQQFRSIEELENAMFKNVEGGVRGYRCERPDTLNHFDSFYVSSQKDEVGRIRVNGNEENWKLADQAVRIYIDRHRANIYAWDKLHDYAALMLDKHLLNKDINDSDVQKAIEFYTNYLIDAKTYETEILAKSLHKLEGIWSQEKIVGYAKFGLKQRDKYSEISSQKEKQYQPLIESQKNSEPLLTELLRK